jgi:hypothetical protein
VIRFASQAALGILLAAALATGGAVAPAHAQPATTGTPNAGTSSSAPVATPSRSHRRGNTSGSTANGGAANKGAGNTGSASTGANSAGVTSAKTSSTRAVPSGRGQFSTEAAARRSCPSDTVVWGNSSSKTLHLSGDRYFGKTKHGAFMCQREAMQAGYHVAGKGAVGGKKTKTSSQ